MSAGSPFWWESCAHCGGLVRLTRARYRELRRSGREPVCGDCHRLTTHIRRVEHAYGGGAGAGRPRGDGE
jgi:hypothetical protein